MHTILTDLTAYYPTSTSSGVALTVNTDTRTYRIMDLWASKSSDGRVGYWYDVTERPGTTGRQVCEGFSTMGNTLYGLGTPERHAGRMYKTRAGLERLIAELRRQGFETEAEAFAI